MAFVSSFFGPKWVIIREKAIVLNLTRGKFFLTHFLCFIFFSLYSYESQMKYNLASAWNSFSTNSSHESEFDSNSDISRYVTF